MRSIIHSCSPSLLPHVPLHHRPPWSPLQAHQLPPKSSHHRIQLPILPLPLLQASMQLPMASMQLPIVSMQLLVLSLQLSVVGVPTFHGRNNEYQQWTIVYNSIRQWIGMRKNRDRGKSKDSQV